MSLRDPMSQMANAQKLSIPQLQQALRNGTIDPQVGQLVLNSKINEDKKRKAAMAAQQPPQPTVAQQDMSYGIDTMPTNLPVAGMAGGGIIAFEEGGDVKHYVNDGLVEGDTPIFDTIHQTGLDAGAPGYFNVRSTAQSLMPMSYAQYMALTPSAKQQYVNQYGAPPERPATTNPLGLSAPSQLQRAIQEGTPLRPQETIPTRAAAAVPVAQPNKPAAAAATPAASTPVSTKSIDDFFGKDTSGATSSRTKSAGIGGFDSKGYKITPYDDKELKDIYKSELNPDTGKPWTYEYIATRNKAQQEAAGIDFGLFKKQQEALDKEKTKSESRSRLNSAMPWFAASEALGQAPKPGEARQSDISLASRALGAYGKSATEIDEKERERQEKIADKGNALALAQNNFNLAQYTGNKADVKSAEADLKAARMGLANLGIKKADQQNEVAKTVFEANNKLQIAAMQEAGANSRYGKEEQTIKSLAKIIHEAHPDMPLDEVMKEAYRTKGAASIYGADVRADAAVKSQYAKYLTDFQKNILNRGKQPMGYDQFASVGMGGSNAGAPTGNTVDFSKLPA